MSRATVPTTLHFDLSFVAPDAPLHLHVGCDRIELVRHTDTSRETHRGLNTALADVPDERLTHFVEEVGLPHETVQLLFVSTPSRVEGASLPTLLLSMIHTPRANREAHVERCVAEGHPEAFHPTPKLAGAEVTMASDPVKIIDVHDYKTACDAAVSLVFHHVELVNIGGATGERVRSLIENVNGIVELSTSIWTQALEHQKDPASQNWAFEAPYLDTNLKPTGTTFYNWSDTTKKEMRGALKYSLRKAKNDPALQSSSTVAGVYTVQMGQTVASTPQSASRPAGSASAAPLAPLDDDYWTIKNLTPHHGFEVSTPFRKSGDQASISFLNSWLRWLSGYVEFYGPDGKPVKPEGWTSMVPGGLAGTYDCDTKKYVGIFSSVNTILAIPVGNTPTEITFPWPSNASSVKFLSGGIGRTGGIAGEDGVYVGGWDAQVCTAGAIMTGVFNFAIPTVCLAFGASVSLSGLNQIAKTAVAVILDVGSTLIAGIASASIQGGNTLTLLTAFVDLIPRLLLDIAELAAWMSVEIAEGAAEESTPIVGWIALAVSVASDVALLLETSIEVASSPATFVLEASRAVDAEWTLLPSVDHQNTWPLLATHFEVTATYRDGTTRATTGTLATSPQTGPITVHFNRDNANRLPAGGDVRFKASFFSDTGWLAGVAVSDYLNADVPGNLLTVPQMHITENLVPLTASTQYQFDKKLVYDAATQARQWSDAGGPPTATVHDLSGSNLGHNLGRLVGVTVEQESSTLGYTWEASGQDLPVAGQSVPTSVQVYAFQAIDDRQSPQDGFKAPPAALEAKPQVLFDLHGPATGSGLNVWVDPREGLYHVRPVALGAPGPFDLQTGTSWGRFNEQIDAAAVHPSGYVVGVNTDFCKLEVLRMGSAPGPDKDAPLANLYSGMGSRPGLLHLPIGVAALPTAGVVVLESPDPSLPAPVGRLQAFDLLGNPAPVFAGGASTVPLHDDGAAVTVLDVDVESKGYLYVLKYLRDGAAPLDYRLDIYNPDGSFLSQTPAVAASKLCVDLWRTLYTLNFEAIVKPDGERTEPSVSLWIPSAPTASD